MKRALPRLWAAIKLAAPLAIILLGCQAPGPVAAAGALRAQSAVLENGLELVVITDRRAPIVTHMIWYRVGAADDPPGKSGLAHFLEHLMFKATKRLASGELSRLVGQLGGNDNALTSHDSTVYYQRVAKEHLSTVMALEADRMVNLQFTEEEVVIERRVVLDERRQRIDASPLNLLSEKINEALYEDHPYAIPVLGWPHEIANLDGVDARSFYERFYAPSNAIVLVAGDISFAEALAQAQLVYGQIPRRGDVRERRRPRAPEILAKRTVALTDARVSTPSFFRAYLAPGAVTAGGRVAATLEVLARILSQGETSRLYQRLVRDTGLAVSTEGGYRGTTRDSSQIALYAVAARGADLAVIEREIDALIAEFVATGISEAELERARNVIESRHVFDSDSQLALAMRYGESLAAGRTIAEIESFLDHLAAVTREDVQAAAAQFLVPQHSATGWLLPTEVTPGSATTLGAQR